MKAKIYIMKKAITTIFLSFITLWSYAQSIDITSPIGGEVWGQGSSQTITWNSIMAGTEVNIFYSLDGGANYTIISAFQPNNGSYNWTLPTGISSSNCKIKVVDFYTSFTFGESPSPFTIPATINVTYPNGGETFSSGNTEDITWTFSGASSTYLELYYSTDGGSTWEFIDDGILASTQTYEWTVPNENSAECLVQINEIGGTNASDQSNANFTIQPGNSITVIYPNGGQVLTAGSISEIAWSYTGNMTYFNLYYSTDGGSTWEFIDDGVLASNYSYTWTVPNENSAECRVKVEDNNNTSIFDISDANFTIQPSNSITVIYPNGGQVLTAGSISEIAWSYTGNMTYFNLYYSTDGGSTWEFIDDGVLASNYSYTWTVPNENSAECRVKVEDNNNTSIFDISDANFTIQEDIDDNYAIQFDGVNDYVVLANSGTFNFGTGNFTWEAWINTSRTGVTQVLMSDYNGTANNSSGFYISTNNALQAHVASNSIDITTGTNVITTNTWHHVALVRNAGDLYIYVDGVQQAMASGFAARNCTSAVFMNIARQPNGSPFYFEGKMEEVRFWNTARSSSELNNTMYDCLTGLESGLVAAYNFNDGPGSSTAVDYAGGNNNGTLTNMDVNNVWIPSSLSCGSAPSPEIQVIYPNGGETLTVGSEVEVAWNYTGSITYLNLYYSTDGGDNWIFVDDGVLASNYSYIWTVPNTPSSECLFKIEDNGNTSIYDESNSLFTIQPAASTIQVLYPNGNEVFEQNTLVEILFTATNDIQYVDLEYTIDGGSTWIFVNDGYDASTGVIQWTTPNINSTYCKVRLSETNNASVFDVSDSYFTIGEDNFNPTGTFVLVNTPNGGESWTANQYKYIYWSSNELPSSYVRIELSLDNGNSWTDIINGAWNGGSYYWYIPNTPSTQCKIRISDYSNNAIFDESDLVFEIKAPAKTISVSTPSNGTTWAIGSTQYIYWSQSNVANVKIEYSFDNGNTWNLVSASTQASLGYYEWTPIPNTPSNLCKVKISDVDNPAVYAISSGVFNIISKYVVVTHPNGGEVFQANSYKYIYWVSSGLNSYVHLQYSTDNGNNWTTIVNWLWNSGSYNWYVPNIPSTQCLIRVIDSYDALVYDDSDNTFEIVSPNPYIVVTTPNGGESWAVGSGQYVYFSAANSSLVEIYYSTDNGSNWNFVDDGITASNGYYYWASIPNTPSNNVLVKIQDSNNPSYFDVSDNVFSIVGNYIKVLEPNGGETFVVNNSHYIYWNSSGAGSYVTIEYSIDGGSNWEEWASGVSNSGSYYWTLIDVLFPSAPYNQCLVRISDYATGTIIDQSDNFFTIAPAGSGYIQVTYPNGGETFSANQGYYVYFYAPNVDYVNLYYSTDGGSNWNFIDDGIIASNGYYYWTTPVVFSTQCLLKVEDNSNANNYDVSNSTFSILQNQIAITSPNGGEELQAGTTHRIKWDGYSANYRYNIHYSIDGGDNWTSIVSFYYTAQKYYDWSVPNFPSTNCLVRVSDYYDAMSTDVSDAEFTILPATPSLYISAPIGFENWLVGSGQYIYWNSQYVNNVMIEYSTDNGTNWTEIINSTSASTGYYYWVIPNTPSNECLVRITDVANPSITSTSYFNFNIIEPYIFVTSPNGGEQYSPGNYTYIYWSSQLNNNRVNLYYSIDNGSNWTTIATFVNNGGSYYWTIPNTPSTQCRIKVEDYYNNTTFDISDNTFEITQPNKSLEVTSPNGGQQWLVGSAQYIYFNAYFVNNVDISYSTNNGASWNNIATNVSSYSGSNWYYWSSIPNTPSAFSKVKVSETGNASMFDVSDQVFTIYEPYIQMTTPNGGEVYTGGNGYYVYWNQAGLSGQATLEYSIDAGNSWNLITSSTNITSGWYYWTVPNTPSVQCLFKITSNNNSSYTDISDNVFEIQVSNPTIVVTSPNGGEQWGIGSGKYIYWSSANVAKVNIEYSIDGGSNWNTIVEDINSNGYYYWIVPNTPSSQCYVRITDASNSAYFDVSNSPFSIVNPTIQVTYPNGGEVWTATNTETIYWNSSGTSGYFRIQYSTDGGASWSNVTNYTANNGFYSWYVPNTPSANCLIRVSDYYNSMVVDQSDNVFEILPAPPSINLTSPNGGEVWAANSTRTIYWNSVSVSYVKIEFSSNGGANWSTVVAAVNASQGYYSWQTPNLASNNCLIRIKDVTNAAVIDQSDYAFSLVVPSIQVTSPNGGEAYTGLTYQYIYWNSTGASSYVTIEFSSNGGTSWSTVSGFKYNNGYHYWQVPNVSSSNCLIRVKDYYNNNIVDVSDAPFSIDLAPTTIILTSPNGGESYGVGTNQYITWSSSNISNVMIEYSINGGGSWTTITSSTPNYGYYYWTIPNNPSSNCLVRVSDASNNTLFDESNAMFSIISPSIIVTSPNGFEQLNAGEYHQITWTSSGVSNYVRIELSTDGGTSWSLVKNAAYNYGYYYWYVPNVSSSQCLIKISDYYNNAIVDQSNNTFTINPIPPSVRVIRPNGGESYAAGQTVGIQWTSSNVTNVKIEYSTNAGSSWNTIIAATSASSGYYSWPIPSAVNSSQCLVKITDITNPTITDESDNLFNIGGAYITVTSPNGGEVYETNSNTYIYWNSLGVNAVDLAYTTDNGDNWIIIAQNRVNNGYYYWNVPNVVSSDYKIKVTATNDTTLTDESNAVFSVVEPTPFITVISPNGGEVWYSGQQYYIRWSSRGVANVRIEYSLNNGANWSTIIAAHNASSGFYYWPVPNVQSTECLIRVRDITNASLNDISNATFTIAEPIPAITLYSPNGGEIWYEGSYHFISWSRNFVNEVNVAYSTDGGSSWMDIANNINSNSYYWNVPTSSASTDCYVKVWSSIDNTVADTSFAAFTIATPVVNTNTIVIDSIRPIPFCKEDTIWVYIDAVGVFNLGNTFTVQLSDSTGNFAWPLAIGSVTDTDADSIACVVPASVLNGTGYRMRVVSSDLFTIGSDNGEDIVISSPEFDFAADELVRYLPNGQVNFTYVGDTTNMVSYEWSFGDNSTSDQINPQHNYSNIGYFDVSLSVTDINECMITVDKYQYLRIERLFENTPMATNTSASVSGVYFKDLTTGFLTLDDGNVLVTSDSGRTWLSSPTGLSTPLTNATHADSLWIITGENGTIQISANNGDTWTPFVTGTSETFYSASFNGADQGFAVGSNGVIYSFNGLGWTAQTSGTNSTLKSVKTAGNEAFAVGENGTIVRFDGSTWATQTSPITSDINEVYMVDENQGYAASTSGQILKWNGTDWQVTLSGVEVNFTSVYGYGADSAWAVSNMGIIYRSLDGGDSWERYSVGTDVNLNRIFYFDERSTRSGRAAAANRGYTTGENGDARWFDDGSYTPGGGGQDTTGTNDTTGVKTITHLRTKMTVYPNPAVEQVTFKTTITKPTNLNVTIKDIEGKLVSVVYDKQIEGEVMISMDVTSFATGTYFVHVNQGGYQWVQKLIITK
jgi:photosystem II stability/assembly factor-like uncharacterized protein